MDQSTLRSKPKYSPITYLPHLNHERTGQILFSPYNMPSTTWFDTNYIPIDRERDIALAELLEFLGPPFWD